MRQGARARVRATCTTESRTAVPRSIAGTPMLVVANYPPARSHLATPLHSTPRQPHQIDAVFSVDMVIPDIARICSVSDAQLAPLTRWCDFDSSAVFGDRVQVSQMDFEMPQSVTMTTKWTRCRRSCMSTPSSRYVSARGSLGCTRAVQLCARSCSCEAAPYTMSCWLQLRAGWHLGPCRSTCTFRARCGTRHVTTPRHATTRHASTRRAQACFKQHWRCRLLYNVMYNAMYPVPADRLIVWCACCSAIDACMTLCVCTCLWTTYVINGSPNLTPKAANNHFVPQRADSGAAP